MGEIFSCLWVWWCGYVQAGEKVQEALHTTYDAIDKANRYE